MSRSGQNPMKWLPASEKPERITVVTIVHVPKLEDYWRHSLAVLKVFFRSLRANTPLPFDLYVFDNGSAEVVQDYLVELRRAGLVQCLVLSQRNLRKLGALNFLLQVAPGEIVSFADSDVLFLPGWLEATLEVLEAFPEAGQVTALPTADTADRHCAATRRGIAQDSDLAVSKGPALIPEHHIEAHRTSLGATAEEYAKRLKDRQDVLISRGDVRAFVSAQDFQFTTRREFLERVLPLKVREASDYYDPVYSPVLERKVDELGLWRLSTAGYHIHHLGNVAPQFERLPDWMDVDPRLFEESSNAPSPETSGGPRVQNRHLRRWLKRVNAATYRMLYET